MQVNNLSVEQTAKTSYIIRGIVDGKFLERQYIGYTKDQATEKFTEAIKKGEL